MSRSIILDPNQTAFIDELVARGRYSSADEAVMAGLELLRDREANLTVLREAWDEGVASGDYQPLEPFLDDLAAHYASRAGGSH